MAKKSKAITTGAVFSSAWKVFKDNLQIWILFGLLLFVPTVLWTLFSIEVNDIDPNRGDLLNLDSNNVDNYWWVIVGNLVLLVYQVVLFSLMVSATIYAAAGKKIKSVGHILELGRGHILKILATTLFFLILTVIGFALLIIPGIIVALVFGLSIYVAADTDHGIIKSFGVSKDYYSKFPGLVFVTYVLIFLIGIAVLALSAIIDEAIDGTDLVVNNIISAYFQIYASVVTAVLYLKIKKSFKSKKKKTNE